MILECCVIDVRNLRDMTGTVSSLVIDEERPFLLLVPMQSGDEK
jgi:hypothetical protein